MAQPTDDETDDALLRRLLTACGPRAAVDAAALARAEAVFRAELGRTLASRRRRWRRTGAWAAAAIVCVVAIVAALQLPQRDTQQGTVATVTRASGTVASIDGAPIATQSNLRDGQVVMTGHDGRAALTYHGADVRLDVLTTVRAEPTYLSLEHGAIYVDTGDAAAGATREIVVRTPLATLGHVGTQFVARYEDDRLAVDVREGVVWLDATHERRELTARAGRATAATIDASGALRVEDVEPFGGAWAWVTELSPDFRAEGSTVDAYLRFMAREYGYALAYAGSRSAERARATLLHGDLRGLSVEEAAAVIGATTRLTVELDDGTLKVESERDDQAEPRHHRQQ